MAYKMLFSVGLLIAFVGMCSCQQQQQQQSAAAGALSQASFQTGSVVQQQPQTKLEDIERDSLAVAFGQKTQQQQQQQQPAKPSANSAVPTQHAYPQQQYFAQPYQAPAQLQFYVQPYQQQQYLSPYQTAAFDYSGVQYMIVNPNAFNTGNQMYYVPAPQPSIVPQYVTKQSLPAAAAAASSSPTAVQQEYKKQKSAAPSQAPQEYQQQSYVVPTTGFQYVQQQPAVAAAAVSPVDFSYVTRHPVSTAQFKIPTPAAVQPQFQYTAVPQQQQQQPQFYYNFPGQVQAAEQQSRVQQSAKSQFSSGVKSTTPTPLKDSFTYKFESSPPQLQQQQQQQQQQANAAYSTIRYSV